MKKILFLISSLFFIFLLSKIDYQNFTYKLLEFYNKTDRIDFFRQNLLTESRFLVLKVTFVTIYIFSSVLFLWKGKTIKENFIFYKNQFFEELKYNFEVISKLIKSTWKQISLLEKIALFIPLVIYVAFWWIYGWQNDEVFSYTFFVDRGILVCATYYPAPNNHVAFLIFSAILNKIIPSFFSDFICLKLPATLSAIFSLWFVWLFFYRKNLKTVAWFCFVLIAFNWAFFFYATHGRGYAWIILFFLWSCFAVFKIISNQNTNFSYKKYWFLWSVCMILGCYTIPIFVYVWFSSLVGLWIIGTNKIRKESIVVSFLSGLIVLILYSPIIIFNGLSAITSNSWVAPLSFEKWLQEFPPYIFDTHGIIGISALVLSVILFLYKKKYRKEFKKAIIYFWCIAYCPYLIAFIQKVVPFERVFLYRQIAELIMLCFCIKILLEKIYISLFNKKVNKKTYQQFFQISFIVLSILYASFKMYAEYYHWNIRTNVYQFAEPLAKKIYTEKYKNNTQKIHFILVLEDTYNVFLRYYFKDSESKIEVLPNKTTTYQIIILPKEKEFPIEINKSNYSVFYEDDFVLAYSLE